MRAFPKPKDTRINTGWMERRLDGREVLHVNTSSAAYEEYRRRVIVMLERQGNMCCLYCYAPMCRGALQEHSATFEHEHGRGHGGGKRDDRIVLPDGTWINGAAHFACNQWKGSRYIDYNRGFQK